MACRPAAEGEPPPRPQDGVTASATEASHPASAPDTAGRSPPGDDAGSNGDGTAAGNISGSVDGGGGEPPAADPASGGAVQPPQPLSLVLPEQQGDLRDEESTEAEQEEQSSGACKQS